MERSPYGNTAMIRRENKKMVLNCLRRVKSASVQELALKTGLSYVTVNHLIRELLKRGEIFPGELLPSAGGRPSQTYCFHSAFRHGAILYGHTQQGRDSLHLRVVDLTGISVYQEDCFPDVVTPELLTTLLERAFCLFPTIAGIGLGLPGEEEDGIITINDYPALVGRSILSDLTEKFGVPVVFENDINAAVIGFASNIAPPYPCCAVGLYFPGKYAPGAGIWLNGEIYRGKHHFAGELGTLPLQIDWLHIKTEEEYINSIAKLIAIICGILAPDMIILYGDMLPQNAKNTIAHQAEVFLQGNFSPTVFLSQQFETHFERGMIHCVLNRIEEELLL